MQLACSGLAHPFPSPFSLWCNFMYVISLTVVCISKKKEWRRRKKRTIAHITSRPYIYAFVHLSVNWSKIQSSYCCAVARRKCWSCFPTFTKKNSAFLVLRLPPRHPKPGYYYESTPPNYTGTLSSHAPERHALLDADVKAYLVSKLYTLKIVTIVNGRHG